MLSTNPENLIGSDAGGAALIRFTAGDARLFVVTPYQIGNSPTSIRLELRDPTTGAQTVLFDAYDRALLGYAISDDGRYIARGGTDEAGVAVGYAQGLYVIDATTGTEVAGDPSATSTSVLGFSHDGTRLFTQTGGNVVTLGTVDLHVISTAPWPSGATFVAVSPQDNLVVSVGGATSYIDPGTGAVLRTLPFPLTRFGGRLTGGSPSAAGIRPLSSTSGRSRPARSFCAPPAQSGTAPSIASLGTPVQANGISTGSVSATSTDGTVTETETFVLHTHATNFYADALTSTATGALLRQFGSFPSRPAGQPFVALSVPSGDRAYTPAYTPADRFQTVGPDVAVWCR